MCFDSSLPLFLSLPLQVTFTEEELPKGSGDFILCYYSNNTSTLVGVTEPFQIQLPTSSPAGSPSEDSSDFTSEDDSSVVGVNTMSRSPSPRKKKHRARHSHSRSPSHSRSRSGSPALPEMKGLKMQPGSAHNTTDGEKEKASSEAGDRVL